MRHALLGVTTPITADTFHQLAGRLGLDVARFEACAADASRYASELQQDRQDAIRIGVAATPSFVIGRTLPGGGVDGTDGRARPKDEGPGKLRTKDKGPRTAEVRGAYR